MIERWLLGIGVTLITSLGLANIVAAQELSTEVSAVPRTDESVHADKSLWSFQPIKDVHPPNVAVAGFDFVRNEVDQFVLQAMVGNDLTPSLPADRVTLLRRLYLDMHGLLPSPTQVEKFVHDDSKDAWKHCIDEVLASHHYGERWARHWLDIVRFGESTGYEVNRDRENAWYYRDYVIDAFNQDKSWQQFVIEQLAGDAVGADVATGFLVGGPYDTVKSPDVNLTLMQREDELADYVNTTSTAFLGLTVGCARCHDHKFDPIAQKDYYALQAVFAGVRHGERQLRQLADPDALEKLQAVRQRLSQNVDELEQLRAEHPIPDQDSATLLEPVNARHNVDRFAEVEARYLRFTIEATNSAEPCLDELEVYGASDRNLALATEGTVATSSGNYGGDPKHQLAHINDGKHGNQHSWISNSPQGSWVQLQFPQPYAIRRVEWGRDRQQQFSDRLPVVYRIEVSVDGSNWDVVSSWQRRKAHRVDGKELEAAFAARLSGEAKERAKHLREGIAAARRDIDEIEQAIPLGYIGTFEPASEIHLLYRGDPMAPREVVSPDTLSRLGTLGLDEDASEQSRRLKFAQWVASNQNPLTARVIVNRVWQYHFGEGLVATPSDFGNAGIAPSHPELLDWLANQFMKNDWSLKWLHRKILMSATYQQSSRPRAEAMAKDADCRWLWRFPPRRLEAEAIRDCVLQVSQQLDLKTGGPGFLLFEVDHENVHHYFPLKKFDHRHFRRMIYMTKIRQEQDQVFGAFDCPDAGQTIPTRTRSTTPLQALNLLNSHFMIEQAEYLAARLRAEVGNDRREQVERAFELAYHRAPQGDELTELVQFVDTHGLEAFCRVLFNSNEFLFMS